MGPQGKKGKPKAAKASKGSSKSGASSPSPAGDKPKMKKKKVMRALAKKEPQLVENTKRALILKGNHTSQVILDVLTDVAKLLKPNCRVMGRKNELYPFEDANSLEFLTSKNDCSLFAIGSHSKKRPHNLILGRTYDGHMLDMVEFGVEAHVALETVKGPKKAVGSKPLMAFVGEQWESDATYVRVQSLLLDMFRGDKIEMISLKGMDHVLVFTVADGKVHLRGHTIAFKKSGTKVPKVELVPMGPCMDLCVRRTQLAEDDLFKLACKKPKAVKVAKVKNVTKTGLGDKVGRLHVKKQNFDKMGFRQATALRERRGMTEDGPAEASTNKGGKRRRIV